MGHNLENGRVSESSCLAGLIAYNSDKTIGSREIRRPVSGTVQDYERMFNKNGLGDHRTDDAWVAESGKA